MSTPSDPANPANTTSRDEELFRQFYQQHVRLVYRYVYSKVGNREEAEDLTTQIFLKVIHHLDYKRDALSMQKWLFQVARTTVIDYWRILYRVPVASLDVLLDAGWEGPMQDMLLGAGGEHGKTIERVQGILLALPENYRVVLNCRFLLNMSIKDTASHLGLSEANVKVLQFRALKRAAELGSQQLQDALQSTLESTGNSVERDYAR